MSLSLSSARHSAIPKALPWLLMGCLFCSAPLVRAFPPNPAYIIYGVVRDQVGATLQVVGAEIILLRNGAEIGRAPIAPSLRPDANYELRIKIDQTRDSTRTYSNKAVPAQGLYSLVVEMNGQRFYPIEVAGTLRAGNGGERVRLDLNLGADTDGDGLPDAWEEWQLFQAGRLPVGGNWELARIDRNGDFDGDGVSNYLEYVAGTFAGDATERFELSIRNKTASAVEFQFFAITGKVYTIETSADLVTWAPVPFSTVSAGAASTYFTAPAIAIQPAFVATTPGVSRFYRLTVR